MAHKENEKCEGENKIKEANLIHYNMVFFNQSKLSMPYTGAL